MFHRQPDPVLREYARLAARYEARWSSYLRASVEGTLARLALREGERLLDVGCGTGLLLAALRERAPGVEPFGVDPSRPMLGVARGRLPAALPLAVARAEQIPFGGAAFQRIVSTSVLHYVRAPRAALAEIHRILEPGGELVLTDWCNDYAVSRIRDLVLRVLRRPHVRTYTGGELVGLLREASFEVVTLERYRSGARWGLMTAVARKPPQAARSGA